MDFGAVRRGARSFLYFHQARIVEASFDDPAARTALFAAMDFSVNALTILVQVFLTSRIIQKVGLAWTLALVPILVGLGFAALAAASTLAVIVSVQVLRRAGNYAVMRPARETLYVVLSREEKYKSKNAIDTVVYRGGDAVSAWLYTGMQALGLSAGGISLAAVTLAAFWAVVGYFLGRKQNEMAGSAEGG